MRKLVGVVALLLLTGLMFPAGAQERPELPCFWRPTSLTEPWLSADVPCMEQVAWPPELDAGAFTSLAMSPDHVLYAASPLTGEVMRFTDEDGDGLPESPEAWLSGLVRPMALAWWDDALYIYGGDTISRHTDDGLSVIVPDVPGDAVHAGGMAIGRLAGEPEARIYIGVNAACPSCETGLDTGGVILSYALGGGEPVFVANGLYRPTELTVWRGELYAVDSAPAAQNVADPSALGRDELNLIQPGRFYGFPECAAGSSCEGSIGPIYTLPYGTRPTGLAGYDGADMPALTGNLLLTLGGIDMGMDTAGYQLAALDLETGLLRTLSPSPNLPGDPRYEALSTNELNWRGVGLYPLRPLDIIVDDRGWAFIALGSGRILAFRPQSEVVY